jgi:predicted TIM-barrel fold metal-dependent hydrolase
VTVPPAQARVNEAARAAESRPNARYTGPVIDVDVHHSFGSPGELLGYLPANWRRLLERSGMSPMPVLKGFPAPGGYRRMDTYPADGRPPGADYELIRAQVLDPLRVERAILSYNVGYEAYHENPYLGAALASASNDWSVERWLSGLDDRLYGGVLVGTQLPDEAAAEIRRVGAHPRLVEVLLVDGGLGPPFGHPIYHPIYAAAAELELPVVVHFGSNITAALPAFCAGGAPQTALEYYPLLNQAAMHHATSLITHGVFERWPQLQVVFLECGCNWIPWLFSALDAQYPVLREESPWVRRLPSEYLRSNMTFGSQPVEAASEPRRLIDLLATIPDVQERLVFSTDYPHWDMDETDFVARHLPAEWRAPVFYENARRLYRWPDRG